MAFLAGGGIRDGRPVGRVRLVVVVVPLFFLTAEVWSVCYFFSHTYQPNSKSTAYYTEAKLSWGFSQNLSRRFALERWASEGGNVALQGRKMPCHGLKSKKNNMPSCPLYFVCIMLGVR